mgnify:CR=1 FL=1
MKNILLGLTLSILIGLPLTAWGGSLQSNQTTINNDTSVANGGTGISSCTDGGVVLGSGTDPMTCTAVLADSEILVGDGTTDPVAETGATLRTSIGVGTGDSPQLTGIELGHATDTTLTRSGAGDAAIEGNAVYRAGGTDVAVTDGGTGAGTFTDAGVLLGNGTGIVQVTTAGTSGQVLTSNGAGVDPTFQAAGSSIPQFISKPVTNVAGELNATTGGSGSITYGTSFALLTGATGNSYQRAKTYFLAANPDVFNGNNNFSLVFHRSTTGADSQFFVGIPSDAMTDSGTALIFTEAHYGFKVIRAASVDTTSATNANGTTETATSFTPNDLTVEGLPWGAVKTGTTNIKYYENKTLRATHTTNLPSETQDGLWFHAIVNNANTAAATTYNLKAYSYQTDLY